LFLFFCLPLFFFLATVPGARDSGLLCLLYHVQCARVYGADYRTRDLERRAHEAGFCQMGLVICVWGADRQVTLDVSVCTGVFTRFRTCVHHSSRAARFSFRKSC
jgi:hypothetical protein